MKIKKYQIGPLSLEIHLPDGMEPPANWAKFERNDEKQSEICYEITLCEDLDDYIEELEQQKDEGQEVLRPDFRMFHIGNLECRLIGVKGRPEFYAVSRETEERKVEIAFRISYLPWASQDTVFTSLLMLERYMLEKGALILHSAYLCHEGEAILFSAPSETGKSTQARLWEQYRGSKTVNGDRSLLYQKEGTWYAAGWPVCGDSDICHNESYPILSVVMLKQAAKNRAYQMRPMQAFQEIFSQVTINGWNREFQAKAMDLVEQLIGEKPVYRLECDISEDAVNCLYSAIKN